MIGYPKELSAYCCTLDPNKKYKNLDYGTIATDGDKVIGSKFPKGTDTSGIYDYMKWIKEDNGWDCYIYYKRTSKLNTKEFSQLLEGVVQECRDVGIETKEDIEIKKLMEKMLSNEKNMLVRILENYEKYLEKDSNKTKEYKKLEKERINIIKARIDGKKPSYEIEKALGMNFN